MATGISIIEVTWRNQISDKTWAEAQQCQKKWTKKILFDCVFFPCHMRVLTNFHSTIFTFTLL